MDSGLENDEALLGRLRQWLADVRAAAESSAAEDPVGECGESAGNGQAGRTDASGGKLDGVVEPSWGLLPLVEQFTALRHELKLQTRSARTLEEQCRTAVDALDRAVQEVRASDRDAAEAATQTLLPMAETLAELDEALDRGERALLAGRQRLAEETDHGRRSWEELLAGQSAWRRWASGPIVRAAAEHLARQAAAQAAIFDSVTEGYRLIRGRLARAMVRQRIERIETVGRPADPHTMTVVDVLDDPGSAPGTVAEEVRAGYTWRGEVLRFAEVRAVRESKL